MRHARRINSLTLMACFLCLCCFLPFLVEASGGDVPKVAEAKAKRMDVEFVSLEDCVQFAIYNSFEVKMAKLDLLIAETDRMYAEAVFDTVVFADIYYAEDKRQQLSVFSPDDGQTNVYSGGISKKIPTGTELKATFSDTRSWNNSPFYTTNPAHTSELALEATQPVGKNFFGCIDRGNISVTKLAIRNADLDSKNRIEALIARVQKDYWELVYARRSLDYHADHLAKAKRLNESNARNYDIGIIEKVDFLASEANLILRETDWLIAKNAYRTAEENLKLLMNMPDTYRIFPSDDFSDVTVEYDLADCLKVAFENRRDYRIRKRDVDIKNITLKMKDNERWPEIDLKGTMAMNGVDTKFNNAADKTTVAENTYYYAGIEISMPLENNLARSEFEKAEYEKEKALLALKETERTVITEVGNSFRDVMTYKVSAVNVSKATTLQAEKLNEEVKRFKRGRSNTKRLIDYQQDLINAEMEEDQTQLNLEKARIDLDRSMNVILDDAMKTKEIQKSEVRNEG